MKKLLRAAAASGVAASTLLGGLAFGPAAMAAPSAPHDTASTQALPPDFTLKMLFGPVPGYEYGPYTGMIGSTSAINGSFETASAAAEDFVGHWVSPTRFALRRPNTSTKDQTCLVPTKYYDTMIVYPSDTAKCDSWQDAGKLAATRWGIVDGRLVNDEGYAVSGKTGQPTPKNSGRLQLTTGRGAPFAADVVLPAGATFSASVPETSPGARTSWVDVPVSSKVIGDLRMTAPEGTTFVAGRGKRTGGDVDVDVDGTVSRDGRTLIFPSHTTWEDSFRTAQVQLRVDSDRTPGETLRGGTMTAVDAGETLATGTFDVKVGPRVVGGGIAPAESPTTSLERGKAVDVPFAVQATATYDAIDADVELTAPAGTTFVEGQDVSGQWADDHGTWNASGDLALQDVRVSDDGKKLTATFDRSVTDDFTQWKDFQLRWFAKVVADDDASSGTASLRYRISGSTSLDTFSIDSTSPTSLDVVNGGVAAASSPTTTLVPGTPAQVPFALKAIGGYDHLDSRVTLTAPAGTTFDEGQTVAGEWADEHGTWHGTAAGLQLKDVRITEGGTKLTGRVESPDDFEQYTDWQLRWHVSVTASTTATPGDGALRYEMSGSTNRGTFTIDATSATTIPESTAVPAPSAYGYFLDDVKQWAGVTGIATPGAVMNLRTSTGEIIATSTANDKGEYNLGVDPSKVGTGKVDLTVTQTVDGKESDEAPATLDYGTHAAVVLTAPANGSTARSDELTFEGTGDTGATVDIYGTNRFLGTDTVDQGTWSIKNTNQLPAGPYNFWATQYTKGGKTTTAPVTVTITDQPATPSAYGYFLDDVKQWAGVTGIATPGAVMNLRTSTGEIIATSTANDKGEYNLGVDPSKVGTGKVDLTVTQTVDGKESDEAPATLDYGTHAAVVLTAPANGSTARSDELTFEGTGDTGATVDIYGTNRFLGTDTVDQGTWSIKNTNQLPAGPYNFWATQYTKGGKTTTAPVTVTITDQLAAPTATGFIDTVNTKNGAGVYGTALPGATVTLRDAAGEVVGSEQADATGHYLVGIPGPKATDGPNTFTVEQSKDGKDSAAATVTIDFGTTTPVTMTSPSNGSAVPAGTVTFSGTGTDGAIVDVYGPGAALGTTKVQDGQWTVQSTTALPAGQYHLWAVQYTPGARTTLAAIDVTVE